MPARSHSGPKARHSANAKWAAQTTEHLRDISEDIAVVSERFLHETHSATAAPEDLALFITALDRLTDAARSALVVHQRSSGRSLNDLAPPLELTADRLRKKYKPQQVITQLESRPRPRRSPAGSPRPDSSFSPKNELLRPRQRLACALTLIQRQSGLTQRTLAEHMKNNPSYISRILSGEREASWRHVKIICDACDVDPDLIKPLWETASDIDPTGHEPDRYLRAYLTALHFAAGSPTTHQILASTHYAISQAELRQALDGPGVPTWSVVKHVTTALLGLPEITRPLWRSAQNSTVSTIRAEAFG
ncbi:helix-turn-helix domain-containing protein [Streptomyces griseus]|uniref:helix-turn-helix domain-containing protein n=1 Tax=Streptomyces griseus TaxID=1911 RepID=UPI003797D6EA